MADDIDIGAVKARLIALRADLLDTGETSAESRQPVELDQSRVGRLSRMDALQGQAMALEIARRRANEVRRIDAALTRIDDGEYGSCVTCGEDVAAKRLDLDPAAAVCIDGRGRGRHGATEPVVPPIYSIYRRNLGILHHHRIPFPACIRSSKSSRTARRSTQKSLPCDSR